MQLGAGEHLRHPEAEPGPRRIVEHVDLLGLAQRVLALRLVGCLPLLVEKLVNVGVRIAAVVVRPAGVIEVVGVAVRIDAAAPADVRDALEGLVGLLLQDLRELELTDLRVNVAIFGNRIATARTNCFAPSGSDFSYGLKFGSKAKCAGAIVP